MVQRTRRGLRLQTLYSAKMINGTDYNTISVGIEEISGFQELVQASLEEVKTTFDNIKFKDIPIDQLVGVTRQIDSLTVSSEFFVIRRPVELVEFIAQLNKHVVKYYFSAKLK